MKRKVLLLMLALTVTGFAETHRFEPTDFYNTFSGAHKPVLHIKPGDHVVTFTIDSRGFDSAGVQRGQRSNPETGPFYIEGAEPGDTLVVHLLRLETNRATGFSATLLAPYTADPSFLREDALREAKTMTWQIDKRTPHRVAAAPHVGLRGNRPGQQGSHPHQFP